MNMRQAVISYACGTGRRVVAKRKKAKAVAEKAEKKAPVAKAASKQKAAAVKAAQ